MPKKKQAAPQDTQPPSLSQLSSIVQAKGTRGEFALAILVEVEVHAARHHDTSCLACGHAMKCFKWLGKTVFACIL